MKATEFCYWLQGFFEIGQAAGVPPTIFSTSMTECIRAHLALVSEAEPTHRNAFVLWLDLHVRGRKALLEDDVRVIRETLAAQFRHVIDPSYSGDQKKLSEIHGASGGTGPGGELYRC